MPGVILFDVNETLLDMGALDPLFQRALGAAEARREWFMTMQEVWLTALVVGEHAPFGEVAGAALDMTAARRGVALDPERRSEILDAMRRLPAHPEVAEGLRILREAGLRVAALTNGSADTLRAQMEHAGLTSCFERLLSAEEVRRLKPAPEPYRMAAERLGVAPGEIRMVAAHAWDVAGAARAGLATAFLARPGKVPNPLGPAAELEGSDLVGLARMIVRRDARGR